MLSLGRVHLYHITYHELVQVLRDLTTYTSTKARESVNEDDVTDESKSTVVTAGLLKEYWPCVSFFL